MDIQPFFTEDFYASVIWIAAFVFWYISMSKWQRSAVLESERIGSPFIVKDNGAGDRLKQLAYIAIGIVLAISWAGIIVYSLFRDACGEAPALAEILNLSTANTALVIVYVVILIAVNAYLLVMSGRRFKNSTPDTPVVRSSGGASTATGIFIPGLFIAGFLIFYAWLFYDGARTPYYAAFAAFATILCSFVLYRSNTWRVIAYPDHILRRSASGKVIEIPFDDIDEVLIQKEHSLRIFFNGEPMPIIIAEEDLGFDVFSQELQKSKLEITYVDSF